MKHPLLLLLAAGLPAATPAEHPSANLSNGSIEAEVYLPDAERGYYRGTRFDWSGVIYSLKFQGHEYFGEWQKSDDPYRHDRITGPVEEYRTDNKGLGYDEAPAGGTFLRIGVGVCEKPNEQDYRWRHSYKVVDPGKWAARRDGDWIEFTQEVTDSRSGYGYRYTKRLALTPGRPELLIEHTLTNTGAKRIESSVYNHNFFVIDGQPAGPDFVVRFPFELRADRDMRGIAAVQGRNVVYLKEVPAGESVITLLDGYGPTAADHRFAIENRKTKAGVRMTADRPLAKLQFWSPRTTLCPEPYIDLRVAPGASESWRLRYEFYTLE